MLFTKFGNPAPATQTIIVENGNQVFYSYGTRIAEKRSDGVVILSSDWESTQTTTYYRNQFLNENTAETRKKVNEGLYLVAS